MQYNSEQPGQVLPPYPADSMPPASDAIPSPARPPMLAQVSALSAVAAPSARVVSQCGDAWHFHDARRVSRFFAADKYTVFRADGTEHVLTESLTSLEARLAPFGFMRTHRSELVNLTHVRQVRRQDQTFELHLADGQRAVTSRRLSAEVRRRLTF